MAHNAVTLVCVTFRALPWSIFLPTEVRGKEKTKRRKPSHALAADSGASPSPGTYRRKHTTPREWPSRTNGHTRIEDRLGSAAACPWGCWNRDGISARQPTRQTHFGNREDRPGPPTHPRGQARALACTAQNPGNSRRNAFDPDIRHKRESVPQGRTAAGTPRQGKGRPAPPRTFDSKKGSSARRHVPGDAGIAMKPQQSGRRDLPPSEIARIAPVHPHIHRDRHARWHALHKTLAIAGATISALTLDTGARPSLGDVPPQAHHAEGRVVESQRP